MMKTSKRIEHGEDVGFRCTRFLWGTAHFFSVLFVGLFLSFFS